MNEILVKQFCEDYCCTPTAVKDNHNHFTVYEKRDGRRKFQESEECVLKIAAINGKLLFTGREDVIFDLSKEYATYNAAWFMEYDNLKELDDYISKFDIKIDMVHSFYICEKKKFVFPKGYKIKKYNQDEIKAFDGDDRFSEAFVFDDNTPDMLGVAAIKDNEILGMAGASADSPYMWQIGINVMENSRRKGIGSLLVSIIKNDILNEGKLPYYGTSMSHITSQKVALNAGFVPTWTELSTKNKY